MADLSLALVQDWLVDFGGAERCLEAACMEFPSAPIRALFYEPARFEDTLIGAREVGTTFLDRPFVKKRYRTFLPLFPFAIEQLDVGAPDVVLSFSHSVAHGVLVPSSTLHVCYCHTPVRYAWDLYHRYLQLSGLTRGPKSWVAKAVLHYLRMWDVSAAGRVDHYIANSKYVAKRIKRIYGREAEVIHPPVEVDRFFRAEKRGGYFVTVGRMVPYKRFDLAVVVCTRLGLPLRVVGEGPEFERLRRLAGPTVTFTGRLNDTEVAEEVSGARAFLFCGEEDFGITPVEAQAAGVPVIAYGRGGALETVVGPRAGDWSKATGLFFDEPSEESLADALKRFEKNENKLEPEVAVANASRFSVDRFRSELRRTVENTLESFHGVR